MNSHPLDRLSLAFGIAIVASGLIIIGQQSGLFSPAPQTLVGLGLVVFAACGAVLLVGRPLAGPGGSEVAPSGSEVVAGAPDGHPDGLAGR